MHIFLVSYQITVFYKPSAIQIFLSVFTPQDQHPPLNVICSLPRLLRQLSASVPFSPPHFLAPSTVQSLAKTHKKHKTLSSVRRGYPST